MGPQAAHAREVVFELRQLDLELALGGVRVVGEDVEDHGGAVDHRHVERRLEVPLLARRELVVARHQVRPGALDLLLQLAELAAAEVAVGIRLGAHLNDLVRGRDPGRPQQLLELRERVLAVEGRPRQRPDRERALARARIAHAGEIAVGRVGAAGHPSEDRLPVTHEGLRHGWNRVHRRARRASAPRARRRRGRLGAQPGQGRAARGARRRAARGRPLRPSGDRGGHGGLRRGHPRRRGLRGRHPQERAPRDVRGQRRRHRERARRGARRRRGQGRLCLDDRRVRQHARRGRGRELRAPRPELHLVLRGDQVRGASGREAADRRGTVMRDRPARRRIRPGRPLGARQADARLPGRAHAPGPVRRPRHEHGARRGRRRGRPARARQGRRRASPTCSATRSRRCAG